MLYQYTSYTLQLLPKMKFFWGLLLYCSMWTNNDVSANTTPDTDTALAKAHLQKADFFYAELQYDSAYYHAQKAASTFLQSCDWENWYASYWTIILSLDKQDKVSQAFGQLREGLKEATERQMDDRTIGKLYNLFGYLYYRDGRYDKAFPAYTLSLEWLEKSGNLNRVESIYNNLGWLSTIRGEYEQAFSFLNKALALYKQKEDSTGLGDTYYNLGVAFMVIKKSERAITCYNKSLAYYNYPDAATYLRLSEAYMFKKNYEKALEWADTALKIAQEEEGEDKDEEAIAFAYLQLGDIFEAMENLDLAMRNFKSAKTQSIEVYGKKHRETAKAIISVGDIYSKLQKPTLAYQKYDEALKCLLPEGLNFQKSSSLNAFFKKQQLQPDKEIGIALERIGDALIQQQDDNLSTKEDLEDILYYYEEAIYIFSDIRTAYLDQADKLFWGSSLHNIFEKAIQTALQLSKHDKSYLKTAFSLIERSKASVLLESIKEQEALQFAEIPDSVFQHIAALKNTIASLAYQKGQSSGKNYQTLQDSIFNTKRVLERTLKKASQQYPTYRDYQQELEPILLPEVQQKLVNPKTLLLEFFMGKERAYVASIGVEKVEVFEIPNVDSVKHHIAVLHKSLANKKEIIYQAEANYRQYTQSASFLYKTLLEKSLKDFEGNQIIIIPDGDLGYIPFEILLTAIPDTSEFNYKHLPYLLKKYNLSYAYSATILQKSHQKKPRSTPFSIAAFAPYAMEGNSLSQRSLPDSIVRRLKPLPFSKSELRKLSETLQGDFFYGKEAYESRAKQACKNASILHFSTHTLIDHANPMYSVMMFEEGNEGESNEGKLHAYELSNMAMQAEMAVLSACETGYGKLSRGEGILSLSRAFVHAGCPSTVMSLWQIDDKASAEVMVNFYAYLQKELPKNEALRQAKLDYLAQTESAYLHPYYWAALVSTGNQSPVNLSRFYSNFLTWDFLGGLLFGLVLLALSFGILQQKKAS